MRHRPALLALTTLFVGSGCNPSSPASEAAAGPVCTASGAKHLTPPITDAAACQRFMRGIAAARGIQSVRLTILPQGVLSAVVTRSGSQGAPGDYGLAVSDRAMTAQDIDALAANVVADRTRFGT